MTYSVFVQPTKTHGYNAIVLGFPFLRAEGATKKEAIDKVRSLLANLMASGEIVQVEMDGLAEDWQLTAVCFLSVVQNAIPLRNLMKL